MTITATTDQYRAQYARNLKGLRWMLERAMTVGYGRKYRGYTVAELEERVAAFERLSAMTDDELRAHLAGTVFHVGG